MSKLIRAVRFYSIYGIRRTIVKVAGRTRSNILRLFFPALFYKKKPDTSLIGCGQFGFSTISFFLYKLRGNKFLECYDVNNFNASSTAKFWSYSNQQDFEKLIHNPVCKYVYVASNHSTHSAYATKILNAHKTVYLEKPIAVDFNQFNQLLQAYKQSNGELYVGYNRPFSKAIKDVKQYLPTQTPFTLNCFIIGHKIGLEHWYRNPEEGTRICGNMGHWLDLAIHLMCARKMIPRLFGVTISQSNPMEVDDNLTVNITTDFGDLVTITLSSREEPFEGINETINLQAGDLISKIDDFRSQQIWYKSEYKKIRYSPKDVGHEKAIQQPFSNTKRDIKEVFISTILMLEIKDMILKNEKVLSINIENALKMVGINDFKFVQ